MDNVAECLYISKSQAVEEMKVYLGDDAGVLKDYEGEGNPANPLPASFRVTVKDLSLIHISMCIRDRSRLCRSRWTVTRRSDPSGLLSGW